MPVPFASFAGSASPSDTSVTAVAVPSSPLTIALLVTASLFKGSTTKVAFTVNVTLSVGSNVHAAGNVPAVASVKKVPSTNGFAHPAVPAPPTTLSLTTAALVMRAFRATKLSANVKVSIGFEPSLVITYVNVALNSFGFAVGATLATVFCKSKSDPSAAALAVNKKPPKPPPKSAPPACPTPPTVVVSNPANVTRLTVLASTSA